MYEEFVTLGRLNVMNDHNQNNICHWLGLGAHYEKVQLHDHTKYWYKLLQFPYLFSFLSIAEGHAPAQNSSWWICLLNEGVDE